MNPPVTRIMTLINPARGYDRSLMRGMARYGRQRGGVQFFQPPPFWVARQEFDLRAAIKENRIDGILMIESEETPALRELKIPLIVSPYKTRRIAGAVNLLTDHAAIGRLAAEHLYASGFRDFAFCGEPDMFWSQDREAGFREGVAELGGTVGAFSGRGRGAMQAWLEALPKPVGILACVDELGRELIELCLAGGFRVPDEVGVLGVDNDRLLCALAPVPLSSVANTAERCGYAAVERIVNMNTKGCRRLKPDLLVQPSFCAGRLSTDFINSDDPAVAKAIRFIRQHAGRPLTVVDAAAASGLSRRVLEKRFKQQLGVSVYSEIRRERVKAFAQLLLESPRPVNAIAEQLGFSNVEHVARYFKAETGLTPRDYRKQFGTQ